MAVRVGQDQRQVELDDEDRQRDRGTQGEILPQSGLGPEGAPTSGDRCRYGEGERGAGADHLGLPGAVEQAGLSEGFVCLRRHRRPRFDDYLVLGKRDLHRRDGGVGSLARRLCLRCVHQQVRDD